MRDRENNRGNQDGPGYGAPFWVVAAMAVTGAGLWGYILVRAFIILFGGDISFIV